MVRGVVAQFKEAAVEIGARYFPKGTIKKGYVVLPDTIARDDNALVPWVEESIRYTRARAGTG
jgi:hypothetical protein